jgi:hypothetical protein
VVCWSRWTVSSPEGSQASNEAEALEGRIDSRYSSIPGVFFRCGVFGIRKWASALGCNSDVVNEAYNYVIADELFNVSDLQNEDFCAYEARPIAVLAIVEV